jgi:hypothetical protein
MRANSGKAGMGYIFWVFLRFLAKRLRCKKKLTISQKTRNLSTNVSGSHGNHEP